MTGCHFTPAQIDELTIFDVEMLFKYWNEFPPAHEILKCVYGVKSTQKNSIPSWSNEDPSGIGALIARFPSGLVR